MLPYRYSHSARSSGLNYLTTMQYTADPLSTEKFISSRLQEASYLLRKDLYAHYGCVNAVEFSHDGQWLVSGGDDKRVLIWDIDKTLSNRTNPIAMKGEHNSNIFCLSFDNTREKLFSAGNDEQVILHDVSTLLTKDVFLHDEAVYGLSIDPHNNNVFASACDDGRILIWDIRASTADAFMLAGYTSAFHAVMHNPVESRLIATANAKEGVGLWDIRKPRFCLMKYGGGTLRQGAMSVRFNSTGTHLLSLRRRLPPILFELQSPQHVAQFDHKEYYNSCTMKSCCFAGDRDQYVLSGSDDFKLYMWRVPEDISINKGAWITEAHLVMKGHRSIVNQVRYNHTYGMLASSGVEKIIKLWSTYPIGAPENSLNDTDGSRKVYSHEEYINLVLESGQFMTHDYSHHSVQEDPRMMAFFDSLVQRDIEGWTSDSSEESTSNDIKGSCFERKSDSSSSDSDSSSSSPDQEDSEEMRAQTQYSSGLNFSTTLCPPIAALIGESTTNRSPELENLTSDKISQLIARKRHNQMVKSARTTVKLKKLLRRIKRHIRNRTNDSDSDSGPSSSILHDAKTVLTAVIRSRIDRRKLLQRKKARLRQEQVVSDPSTDSDMNEDEPEQPGVSMEVKINLPQENGHSSQQSNQENTEEGKKDQEGDENIHPTTNGGFVASVPENKSASVSSSNGNTSRQAPRVEGNSSLAHKPSVVFQRNGKFQSRNYRKRNTDDDIQDES